MNIKHFLLFIVMASLTLPVPRVNGKETKTLPEALPGAPTGTLPGAPTGTLPGAPTGTLDEALEHFIQGKDLYYKLSIEQSLEHLNKALTFYDQNMAALTDGERLYDTHIFIALCHFSKKNMNAAKKSVQTAYHLNPKRELDIQSYPPPFIAFFKKSVEAFPALTTGRLEVLSTPPFATIYVNGFKMGMTPLVISSWPSGEVHLKVVLDDHEEWYQKINLAENKDNRHQATLKPLEPPTWITQSPLSSLSPTPEETSPKLKTISPDMKEFLEELEKQEATSHGQWKKSIWLWSLAAAVVGGVTYGVIRSQRPSSPTSTPTSVPPEPAQITAIFP